MISCYKGDEKDIENVKYKPINVEYELEICEFGLNLLLNFEKSYPGKEEDLKELKTTKNPRNATAVILLTNC